MLHTFTELFLRRLCSVFGTCLSACCDALSVESSADDVITHTGQISYSAASDENDRVLLQIVSLAGDVACDLDTVGKTNSGDLTKS